MKRSVPLFLALAAVFISCAPFPALDPAKDPLFKKIERAKCDYAALQFRNDYRWTVQLHTYPVGRRLGEVNPANDEIFCIRKQDLYEDYLSLRIRSVANPNRQGGVIATTKPAPVLKGEVWRFSVPSISLDGWQILRLPYSVGTEE